MILADQMLLFFGNTEVIWNILSLFQFLRAVSQNSLPMMQVADYTSSAIILIGYFSFVHIPKAVITSSYWFNFESLY